MSASKAHRYLVSLVRSGLVAQHDESGLYDLGDLALTAGLTKLSRVDAYQVALEFLSELRTLTDETVLLAVWNGQAPIAIRWMEAERPVNVHVRLGTALPVMNSATGRAFAAHMPVGMVGPAIEGELALGVTPTLNRKTISRGRISTKSWSRRGAVGSPRFAAILRKGSRPECSDIRSSGCCSIRHDGRGNGRRIQLGTDWSSGQNAAAGRSTVHQAIGGTADLNQATY